MKRVKIAIIGGTGIYSEDMLERVEKISPKTPYGKPSSDLITGDYKGKRIAFLFRHGSKHTIPPHSINFQANLWSLKELGVRRVLATAAVGSLKEEMKPGDIIFPDQFIDMGKDVTTFYHGPDVLHISMADPFCPELRSILIKTARELGIKYHDKGTYLRISGPRFSTRAESSMFRRFADIVGMTCIPEAILARELGICYAVIATVTDYDVWAEKPVNAEEVIKTMKDNALKTENILKNVIDKIPEKMSCECGEEPKKAKF